MQQSKGKENRRNSRSDVHQKVSVESKAIVVAAGIVVLSGSKTPVVVMPLSFASIRFAVGNSNSSPFNGSFRIGGCCHESSASQANLIGSVPTEAFSSAVSLRTVICGPCPMETSFWEGKVTGELATSVC